MVNRKAIKNAVKQILNSNKSDDEIVEIIQSQSKTGVSQLQIIDGFNAVAQDQGRYAGGSPTLGDEISDSLACRVKKYGSKSFKLSDKQVKVIVSEVQLYKKI